MKNKKNIKFVMACLIAVTAFASSCKKEEALAPASNTETGTVLYIRAVNTDSSAIESQRILLR